MNHPAATATHDHTTHYTCSMHPEVTSDHPGRCPKCGMFLQPADGGDAPAAQHHDHPSDHQHPMGEPAVVAGAVAAGDWTCPMHPEVRSDGPGDCPICGMALERVLAGLDEGPNQELVDMRRRFRVAAVLSDSAARSSGVMLMLPGVPRGPGVANRQGTHLTRPVRRFTVRAR